jgi:hypothetical protein
MGECLLRMWDFKRMGRDRLLWAALAGAGCGLLNGCASEKPKNPPQEAEAIQIDEDAPAVSRAHRSTHEHYNDILDNP